MYINKYMKQSKYFKYKKPASVKKKYKQKDYVAICFKSNFYLRKLLQKT